MNVNDEKSDNVFAAYLSDMSLAEGEALIGKTVQSIDAGEYSLTITFTDGSTIECCGSNYDGCSLGVTVESPDIVKPPVKTRSERRMEEYKAQLERQMQNFQNPMFNNK